MREVFDEYLASCDPDKTSFKWQLGDGRIMCITVSGGGTFKQKNYCLSTTEEIQKIIMPILAAEPYKLSIYDSDGSLLHMEGRQCGHCFWSDSQEDRALYQAWQEAIERLKDIDREIAHQKMLAARRAKRAAAKKKV